MTSKTTFGVTTRADLLNKLEHDYQRIVKDSSDFYSAFDFFITALHIEDWPPLEPSVPCADSEEDRKLRQICSHLANGLKHFTLNDRRHNSVTGTGRVGFYGTGAYGSGRYATEYLVIHLADDAAELLDMHDGSIDVITLADKVLSYWKHSLHICYKEP